MRELVDSRCIAGLLAIAVTPFAMASALYRDEIAGAFRGLNIEVGTLSSLIVDHETAVTLPVVVIALALATLRTFGPENASIGTVRSIQLSIVVSAIGSWVAMHAAFGPVRDLMDKIR